MRERIPEHLNLHFTERDNPTGNRSGHFITRFLSSTGPLEAMTSAW
jgi:hypothetical protein